MEYKDFPIFKTKSSGVTKKFNLADPDERREYFQAKVGKEIEKIKEYQQSKTFVGFMIGKKNTGKGTYTKLFMEMTGKEHSSHLSIGDLVRDVHASLDEPEARENLVSFLKKHYRGFHPIAEMIASIENRSQGTLIPSELIIALIKYEISKRPKQSLFIDGFPRALDQVSYSLFLKELIGYRDDPDFMVFISVPEMIIDERIKYRVICPKCKTPRNLKLLATQNVGYDREKNEFYLICEDPACGGARMVRKEGDELGIEPIRERLKVDDEVVRRLTNVRGLPQIFLRNALPASRAEEYVDDYEITPAYSYEFNKATGKVKISEAPWIINDDDGTPSCSLLSPAVAVAFIKQIAGALEL